MGGRIVFWRNGADIDGTLREGSVDAAKIKLYFK